MFNLGGKSFVMQKKISICCLKKKEYLPSACNSKHIEKYQHGSDPGNYTLLFCSTVSNSHHAKANVNQQGDYFGRQPAVGKGVLLNIDRKGNSGYQ